MDGLLSCQAFRNFGPDSLAPDPEPPPFQQIQGRRPAALREAVRKACPQRPGVYGMIDANGLLIYVGKAKRLRTRLLSYFRSRSRDPKAGRIARQARAIVWEYTSSEFGALLRELELIHRWQPRLNVQDQPRRRRRTFVCLGRRPAPYLFLARRPPAGALAVFGPIPAGLRATEAVRRLNDWFQLRDCSQSQEMIFAGQGELFPVLRAAGCLRYEIGTCLGPCLAACTSAAYHERIRAACAFLDGTDSAPLVALKNAMAEAAAAFDYERAGALRDKLAVLDWLRDRLDWLRQARERHSFIYPVKVEGNRDLWYLIHRGRVEGVLATPESRAERRAAVAHLEAVFHGQPVRPESHKAEEIDKVLLVARWFRRHPEERARAWQPEQALAVCRTDNALRLSQRIAP